MVVIEKEYPEWLDLYTATLNEFEISEDESRQLGEKVNPVKLYATYSGDPVAAAHRALRMAIPEHNVKQKHPPPKFKLYMKRRRAKGTENFIHESLQDLSAHGLREAIMEGISIVVRILDVETAYVIPASILYSIDPAEARLQFEQMTKKTQQGK